MVSVPRDWAGQTCVILATGPSLTQEDVDYCRGRARVIAINNAVFIALWADAMYATDAQFWAWHRGVPEFTGPKWSLEHSKWNNDRARYTAVQRLRSTGADGLERNATGLRNGSNSGFAAINLAFHYGVKRILLLGYDMQPAKDKSHFFGEHVNKSKSPYDKFRRKFPTLVKPLAKSGVRVVNCTRKSVLTAFPMGDLHEELGGKRDTAKGASTHEVVSL